MISIVEGGNTHQDIDQHGGRHGGSLGHASKKALCPQCVNLPLHVCCLPVLPFTRGYPVVPTKLDGAVGG
jgi:hypothetical protein